jgi:hypothetical protein
MRSWKKSKQSGDFWQNIYWGSFPEIVKVSHNILVSAPHETGGFRGQMLGGAMTGVVLVRVLDARAGIEVNICRQTAACPTSLFAQSSPINGFLPVGTGISRSLLDATHCTSGRDSETGLGNR